MKLFSIVKTIKKGLAGATIAGASAAAVIEYIKNSEDLTMDQVEQSLAVIAVSIIGFAFQSIKNYLKNREKIK